MRAVKISRHYVRTSAEKKKLTMQIGGRATFLGEFRRFHVQNGEMHLNYNDTMFPHFNVNVRVFIF